MATSEKIQKDIWQRWADSSGTYFYFEVKVNLWVDVDVNGDTYTLTFHSEQVPGSWKEQADIYGGGFVDCYGLFWDPGSSVGCEHREMADQSLSLAQGQAAFTNALMGSDIHYSSSNPLNWCIGGVAIKNSTHEYNSFGTSGTTYTKTMTKAEYEALDDSYVVLGLATRWLDQGKNQAVVSMQGYELKWSELFPNYIPWSVYYTTSFGTTNYSCNRKTTKETGHSGTLVVYEAGKKSHVVYNGSEPNKGFYYDKGNKGTVSPKFGRFKDE